MDLSRVKLLFYDCDGVLTDNHVIVSETGEESAAFHRGDGTGVRLLRENGIRQVIVSTEVNPIVEHRARKLKIEVVHAVEDKRQTVLDYCAGCGISPQEAMFIGNDVNDLAAMKAVGACGCPRDAEPEILAISQWVSAKNGGHGVIRELSREILQVGRRMDMTKIKEGLIYAIVPARSGSTGVKNKNIKPLAGHPLMAYSIAAGKLTPEIDRVIVSTDSEEYARIARGYGADVPFLRPAEISGNMATDLEFMLHAIQWLDEHEGVLPEYWVHLRPTTPLRDIAIIRSAIGAMKADKTADSLRSAHKTDLCPFKWFWRSEDGYFQSFNGITLDQANGPRQGFPVVYVPDGYVDVLKTEYIVKHHLLHGERMIGFEVPESTDIDSMREYEEVAAAAEQFDNEIVEYLKQCGQQARQA